LEDQVTTQLVDLDSWQIILTTALLITMIVISTVMLVLMLMYIPKWGKQDQETIVYRERERVDENGGIVMLGVEEVNTPSPQSKRRGRPPKKPNGHKAYRQHGARVVKSVRGIAREASNAEIDQRFYDDLYPKTDTNRS